MEDGAILDGFWNRIPEFTAWLASNEQLLWWLAASSLILFLASLILVPWLRVRIPADYFVKNGQGRSTLRSILGPHPFAIALVRVLRSILGLTFIIVGLLLLVLPGQGLLMIFMGILISDFPGKRRAVNWLVAKPSICRPINWLRRRAGKVPILPPRPR